MQPGIAKAVEEVTAMLATFQQNDDSIVGQALSHRSEAPAGSSRRSSTGSSDVAGGSVGDAGGKSILAVGEDMDGGKQKRPVSSTRDAPDGESGDSRVQAGPKGVRKSMCEETETGSDQQEADDPVSRNLGIVTSRHASLEEGHRRCTMMDSAESYQLPSSHDAQPVPLLDESEEVRHTLDRDAHYVLPEQEDHGAEGAFGNSGDLRVAGEAGPLGVRQGSGKPISGTASVPTLSQLHDDDGQLSHAEESNAEDRSYDAEEAERHLPLMGDSGDSASLPAAKGPGEGSPPWVEGENAEHSDEASLPRQDVKRRVTFGYAINEEPETGHPGSAGGDGASAHRAPSSHSQAEGSEDIDPTGSPPGAQSVSS